jgi:hypothetical protein
VSRPSTLVYFVQAGNDVGPVKIGVTCDISKRIEMLQTGSWEPLKLLATFSFEDEQGARGAEQGFHYIFEPERLNGEWFAWTDDIADMINGMRSIERAHGPKASRLDVSFEIWRKAEGGIVFRPSKRAAA